jgi:hypothetical protein
MSTLLSFSSWWIDAVLSAVLPGICHACHHGDHSDVIQLV